jgi:hypothetical protein
MLELTNVVVNTYLKCKYKNKCTGNIKWCDGKITPICRKIQEKLSNLNVQ